MYSRISKLLALFVLVELFLALQSVQGALLAVQVAGGLAGLESALLDPGLGIECVLADGVVLLFESVVAVFLEELGGVLGEFVLDFGRL